MFKLADNPFVVLGVTPRMTKAEIHDAIEDAMLDADGVEAERKLEIARQMLISPNERLKAELGYLLEMRPADARRVLSDISAQHWLEVANATEGVARTNALTQAVRTARTSQDSFAALTRMFAAWEQTDEADVMSRINEARAIAGVTEASSGDVRRGLAALREHQARQSIECLAPTTQLPSLLSDLLLESLIPAAKVAEKFPAAVLAAYHRKMDGALTSAAGKALSGLTSFVSEKSEQAFNAFERELRAWDALAQPLQLASEAKGADDAHSKELYEQIRQGALDLANVEDRHHDALRITDLTAEVFAELPWAADAIQKDAQDLNEIIANQARNRFLHPLAAALHNARENLFWTSQHLASHGFRESSPDPIGAIWRSYVDTLDPNVDLEMRDLGARMIRSLSIELVNERSDVLSARMLNSQLLADGDWFSPEVRKLLEGDETQLMINLSYQHLKSAISREDWNSAKQICSELIAISPSSEISELRKMERGLEGKIRSRTAKRVMWGGVAALVLGVVVFDDDRSSDSNYEAIEAAADTVEIPAIEALAAAEDIDSDAADSVEEDTETLPPPYMYGSLSLSQLRYCLRQSERLDLARNMTVNYAQESRFNAAIRDYNSRCGSFQYDESDMAIARSEIATMRSVLVADAQAIIGPDTSDAVGDFDSGQSTSTNDAYLIDEAGNLVSTPSETANGEDSSEILEEEAE